jgi:hypothetical protein
VSDIEIALNSEIVAGRTLPVNYTSNLTADCDSATATTRVCLFFNSSVKIPLAAVTSRTYNANNPTGATTSSSTNYCYTSTGGTSYIVGVELEAGGFFYKNNSGDVISSSTAFAAAGCTDNRM